MAVDMVAEVVSTAVVVASTPAVEELPEADLIRLHRVAMERRERLPRPVLALRVAIPRGLAIAILVPAMRMRAATSDMGILLRHPLGLQMGDGIRLPGRAEAVNPRAGPRRLRHRTLGKTSTCLAEIVRLALLAELGAFPVKAVKSGKMLRPREIWFPSLSRFLPCTIRL
jgi:hypothetical protein